jgi:LysM repeat protein
MGTQRNRFLTGLFLLILIGAAIVSRGPVLHPSSARLEHSTAPLISKSETSNQARAMERQQPPSRPETRQAQQATPATPKDTVQQTTEARASEMQNLPPRTAAEPAQPVTPAVPEAVAGATIYTVRQGESVESIALHYLSQTSFMTSGELAAAIRQANGGNLGKALHAGQQMIIPGVEAAPIVERSVLVPKDLEIRGIYLTGWTAGSEKGLELIRRWREGGGNTVVFDAKDFDGLVNVPFSHPLVPNQPHVLIHNLPKFARFLHSLNLHAIARIALFRDQYLLEQHPELAVRSRSSGRPWRENGKLVWTDPSRTEVQEYNLALARTVAKSGVDEIQFDYVRFPAEGDQKDAKFAFESAHPDWQRSDVISDFLSRAYSELHPLGVLVSLDVFGVMAWQRQVDLDHTGQDIPAMAQYCDVLSPMIYPSHFFGMDGYATPGNAPEHFIGESMDRFREITADTGVVLRPWLQAFAWRTPSYSPAYVRTQVSVAKSKGGIGFLFWNARNDYTNVFPAMTEMRSKPGQFFRGDQVRIDRTPGPAKEPAS